jgi:hypothetical protein
MKRAGDTTFVEWLSRIGSDPADGPEVALQKRLVLVLTLLPAPAGFAWGLIYIAAGATLPGIIPEGYFFVALANTALFAVTRNLALYRFSQLLSCSEISRRRMLRSRASAASASVS